ncbi:MAG TPA: glutathionylspermidine synthase family protein [Candidatus Omnitrophota bacterium]|nr:glutathionylspermidine synthase family protein [Candidatus Omnitrophota bacterium]HPS36629.1 glutathionylspermidine synthase family protein [Candidatus Omnitrophota bacterium]
MSANLDHAYDQYLTGKAGQAVPAILQFREKLKGPQFAFGRFTVPAFYKGYFVTPKQHHLLKRVSSAFHQILNTTARLYFEEVQLRSHFRLSPEAEELVKIDPGYSQHVVFSRFDALLEGESLKLLEFNSDVPAGAAYTDQLESAFLSEELVWPFAEEHHLASTERVQSILTTLLSVYEEFGGYETPQIAIVEWRHARTSAEFTPMKSHFESKGYKTTIADPRELQYKGGKLYHKGFRVHLIYRRAAFDELVERLDEVQDLVRAYKDKAVCMVNPLCSRLASSKSIFSLLTTPEFDRFFTENENTMKQQHLPWTRCLADAEDFYGNRKVFIIDFLKDEKETLVLKPNGSSHGARRVYVGRETPDSEWNAVVDRALKEEDWVIQEQVPVPILTVPVVVNQKLDFAYKKYNFNLLVSGGKYSGGFVRLSDESVINVATGGGLMPAIWSDVVPEGFTA